MKESSKKAVILRRIKRRQAIKRTILSLCVILIAIVALKIPAITMTSSKGIEAPGTGKGHFQIKIDESLPKGETVDVSIRMFVQLSYVQELAIYGQKYVIQSLDGSINEGTINTNVYGHTFSNLKAGDIVTLLNISKIQHTGSTYITTTAKGVDITPKDNIFIEEGKTKGVEVTIKSNEGGDFKSTSTFKDLYGEYSIVNLLNRYNVFSFGDVESKHIFGTIASNKKAFYLRTYGSKEYAKQPLMFAEYTRGVSSFVRDIDKVFFETQNKDVASYKLNYFYEKSNKKDLYVGSAINISNENGTYYFTTSDDGKMKSPNGEGELPVYINDNFIDFQVVKDNIIKESNSLLLDKGAVRVRPNEYGVVVIPELGKNYIIENSEMVRIVNILYPAGYDPRINPYPHPTVISFKGELAKSGTHFKEILGTEDFSVNGGMGYIEATTYNEIEVYGNMENFQYFPEIFVDGKVFSGNGSGYQWEYGDYNGVVFNLPNVTTGNGKVTTQVKSDILGHIVAPNATIWNAVNSWGTSSWKGGNINGSVIVENWYGGGVESHVWPLGEFDILYKPEVEVTLQGNKNYVGNNLTDGQFSFILDLFDKTNGIPEGIENKNLPQKVTVDKDGNFKFSPLTFTKAGVYEFLIKEDLNNTQSNIIYDKTQYKIIVTVESLEEELKASYKIIKVMNFNGDIIQEEIEVKDINFTNYYGNPKLANFSFIKVDEEDNTKPLEGAVFELVEIVSKDDHTQVGNYKFTATSDGKGKISFENIPSDKVYKMTEVKSPDGYKLPKGYWIIKLSGEGNSSKVEVTASSDNMSPISEAGIITNKFEDYRLPETGGKGLGTTNLIGGLFIFISILIILKRK